MKTALLVGHISLDHQGDQVLLGGPPLYQAPVLLANHYEIEVVSSFNPLIGPRIPEIIVDSIKFITIPSEFTTTFEFIFTENDQGLHERSLRLKQRAARINYDIVKDRLKSKYDVVIISPIADELDLNDIESFRILGKKSSIDLQGLIRYFGESDIATNVRIEENLEWVLNRFDVVKTSEAEIADFRPKINYGDSILLITRSGNGVEVISEQFTEFIPTTKISKFVDDTGSGDMFLAGFMISEQQELKYREGIIERINYADKVARLNLQNKGIPSEEIIKKIKELS